MAKTSSESANCLPNPAWQSASSSCKKRKGESREGRSKTEVAEQGSGACAFGAGAASDSRSCASSDNELHPYRASFEGKKERCKMVCRFCSYVRGFGLICSPVGTEFSGDPDAT